MYYILVIQTKLKNLKIQKKCRSSTKIMSQDILKIVSLIVNSNIHLQQNS